MFVFVPSNTTFKVWSVDQQQPQNHLKIHEKCGLWGLIQKLLNESVHFKHIQTHACSYLRNPVLGDRPKVKFLTFIYLCI